MPRKQSMWRESPGRICFLPRQNGFNRMTARMEELGLVILKNEHGEYVTRGNRNIKINDVNFTPFWLRQCRRRSGFGYGII